QGALEGTARMFRRRTVGGGSTVIDKKRRTSYLSRPRRSRPLATVAPNSSEKRGGDRRSPHWRASEPQMRNCRAAPNGARAPRRRNKLYKPMRLGRLATGRRALALVIC